MALDPTDDRKMGQLIRISAAPPVSSSGTSFPENERPFDSEQDTLQSQEALMTPRTLNVSVRIRMTLEH